MDVTYVYISNIPVLYLVLVIDDYSRFCVGSRLCHDQRSGTMVEVLHQAGEIGRIEAELKSHFLDFSRGYLVFKNQEHTLSVVCSPKGIQVFLDGSLLSQKGDGVSSHSEGARAACRRP